MKQLDFLLLGIDHLVNTYNIIRNLKTHDGKSFTIFPIVVDNGYQGPQSSLNNLADFCSIARIDGFTITNKWDAEKIISSKLVSPGFRIITVSQRLFKDELIVPEKLVYSNSDSTVFQYSDGVDVTIVCFNFSFPQGWELYQELKSQNINATIFTVNSATSTDWSKIIENVQFTQKLIIIDDSKSYNIACDSLIVDICEKCNLKEKDTMIDAIYYCPHRPDENCHCRKPQPELILRATKDFNIDLASSWMIGDSDSDVKAAESAGCRSIKITPDFKLDDAVQNILNSRDVG